jgi:hypothetical protein
MVFRRLKSKRFYPQWHEKMRGCDVRVFQIPDGGQSKYYHFSIVCEDRNIKYSSLDDMLIYKSFEDVCEEAETWVRENVETEKL